MSPSTPSAPDGPASGGRLVEARRHVLALGPRLRRHGQDLATAESCTGGLIATLLTQVPGSSDYFLGGVVSYANSAKIALLGVAPELLAAEGAVSEAVALAMAEGIQQRLGAAWALAVTGVAGPGGGGPGKPVGTVWIALARPAGEAQARLHHFAGGREAVQAQAAAAALAWLLGELDGEIA